MDTVYLRKWTALGLVLGLLAVWQSGCSRPGQTGSQPAKKVIRVAGSDTMVNIAQAWAEQYGKLHPDVSVQVRGGGSGVGIAALIDGNCDMADASRQMEPKEIEQAKAKRGAEPKETVVGLRCPGPVRPQGQPPGQHFHGRAGRDLQGDGGTISAGRNWA